MNNCGVFKEIRIKNHWGNRCWDKENIILTIIDKAHDRYMSDKSNYFLELMNIIKSRHNDIISLLIKPQTRDMVLKQFEIIAYNLREYSYFTYKNVFYSVFVNFHDWVKASNCEEIISRSRFLSLWYIRNRTTFAVNSLVSAISNNQLLDNSYFQVFKLSPELDNIQYYIDYVVDFFNYSITTLNHQLLEQIIKYFFLYVQEQIKSENFIFTHLIQIQTFHNLFLKTISSYRSYSFDSDLNTLDFLFINLNSLDFGNSNPKNNLDSINSILYQPDRENTYLNFDFYLLLIIKEYINVQMEYSKYFDHNYMYYTILHFLFRFIYSTEFSKIRHISKVDENKKKTFNITITYINYSKFWISHFKTLSFFGLNSTDISDEIKYNCFYIYQEISGNIAQNNILAAFSSCSWLRDLITALSFVSTQTLSKVCFNYISFLYQIKNHYKNKINWFEFYKFIFLTIFTNQELIKDISINNKWNYLYMLKINFFIDDFDINQTEVINIIGGIPWRISLEQYPSHWISIIKKVKYVHLFELELILHYIFEVWKHPEIFETVSKDTAFIQTFKKKWSYLWFNNDFTNLDSSDRSWVDIIKINEYVFEIINRWRITDMNEYCIIPKKERIDSWIILSDFINYIYLKIQKKFNNNSIVEIDTLFSDYIINVQKNKNNWPILAFAYNHYYRLNITKGVSKDNLLSPMWLELYRLIQMISQEEKIIINNTNGNISTQGNNINREMFFTLLFGGSFHWEIAMFVIINSLYSLPGKCPFDRIINYLTYLLKSEKKSHWYYMISIYKTIDIIVNQKLSEVQNNIESKGVDDFYIYKYIRKNSMAIPKKLNSLKTIIVSAKYLYSNWKELKRQLCGNYDNNSFFAGFWSLLHWRNFSKTFINICDSYVYDYWRENNKSEWTEFPNRHVLKMYYECLARIEDNAILLQKYFTNSVWYKYMFNVNTSSSANNLSSELSLFYQKAELYFLKCEVSDWYKFPKELSKESMDSGYFLFIIFKFLSTSKIFITKDKTKLEEKAKFKKINNELLSCVARSWNKSKGGNERFGHPCLLFILYDIYVLLNCLGNLINSENYTQIKTPNQTINSYFNQYITSRKFPYMNKYLIIFKIRRCLCNIINDQYTEWICVRDIVKTLKHNINIQENTKEIENYWSLYYNLIMNFDKKNISQLYPKIIYTCFKYYTVFLKGENDCIKQLYDWAFILNNKVANVKFEILFIKQSESWGYDKFEINKKLFDFIKKYFKSFSTTQEEDYTFCIKADYYWNNFYSINESFFERIKINIDIYRITLDHLDMSIFDYLRIAIQVCNKSNINDFNSNKLLTKYLPEVINYLFKIQIAKNNTKITATSTRANAFYKEFLNILEMFQNIPIANIKIILPQLLVSYIFNERTDLNHVAVLLWAKYANENIDLCGFWLGSYLCSKEEDNIKLGGGENEAVLVKYNNNVINSKKFGMDIFNLLTESNKKIITMYQEFQTKLKNVFWMSKKWKPSPQANNKWLEEIDAINHFLASGNYRIILPTIENLKWYNPKVRDRGEDININNENISISKFTNHEKKKKVKNSYTEHQILNPLLINNNTSKDSKTEVIDNNTLYIYSMKREFLFLQSKERPLRIKFRTCHFHNDPDKSKDKAKYPEYTFLLKGDLADISKEMKTYELFNELNNIFQLNHYDTEYKMKLHRYWITPISSQIVIAEWWVNSAPLQSIINEKLLIENDWNVNELNPKEQNPSRVRPNSLTEAKDKFNVLYQHYYYSFPDVNKWFEAQNNYIISTAIWSMTCWWVGLGDRHWGNIMMGSSGEVIHIDFGYVLGKGLVLPVPEVVDFRFTKNIRKSLGLFEENGLFIDICMKCWMMFRDYYRPIISRMEYYIFDPFFNEVNDKKSVPLIRVRKDYFTGKTSTVEKCFDIVTYVIRKCGNNEKLESMYIWWAPAL